MSLNGQANLLNASFLSRWILAITLFLSIFSFTVIANAAPDTTEQQRTESLSDNRQKLKRSVSYRSCIRKYYSAAHFFTGKYNNITSRHNLVMQMKWRLYTRPPSFTHPDFYAILIHLPTYPQEDFQPAYISA